MLSSPDEAGAGQRSRAFRVFDGLLLRRTRFGRASRLHLALLATCSSRGLVQSPRFSEGLRGRAINQQIDSDMTKMKSHLLVTCLLLLLSTLNSQLSTALAQGTVFTYQGRLDDGGT